MDIVTRLRRVLPGGWFADVDPVLDTILSGAGAVWTVLLGQVADTRRQARLLTATGGWLEGRVADYLSAAFTRAKNEADFNYAARAAREILRPRATRPSIERLLRDEGSPSFRVFEPFIAADTGGYDLGGIGYGVAGGWGSLLTPYQVFIDAKRPQGGGIPNSGGYGSGIGYDVGGGAYGTLAALQGGITDAEFYGAIARVVPAGVTAWTRLN